MTQDAGIYLLGGTLQYSSANQYDYSKYICVGDNTGYKVDTNGQNVTWAGALTGYESYLGKYGTGTLTLTATTSNYTWGTAIYGGTVNVGAAQQVGPNTGPLGMMTAGAGIYFLGGTLQYSGANQYDYSPYIAMGPNTPYSVDTNGQNVNWASSLTGSNSSLAKYGSGTLTLSAAATYTGATTVNGGTLALNGAVSMASSLITNNATFDVSGVSGGFILRNGQTLTGSGSVTGGVTVAPGATLKGTGTYNGR